MTASALVVIGVVIFGLGKGMCDVAMNVEGAANERALGRTLMPLFHASFSMGTIVGAGIGAAAERLGVPIAVHLAVIGALMIVAVLLSVRLPQPDPFATAEHSHADQSAQASRGGVPDWVSGGTVAPC